MAITDLGSPQPLQTSRRTDARLALRNYGAAVLSGLLVLGSFPHLDWGWLAWIALVPMLLTYPHARLRDALGQAFVFGFLYFGGVLYWLAIMAQHALGAALGVVAWAIGSMAQVSVMLLFGFGAHLLSRVKGRWAWALGIPALWTALEWVRQLGELGTGWGDLAYTQHNALTILQLTKLGGVWPLTFLIVLVNMAVAGVIARRNPPRFVQGVLCAFVLVLVFGGVSLRSEHLRPRYVAAALQTNINPNVPWSQRRPEDPVYVENTMRSYSQMEADAAARGAIFAAWPEATFPGYLRDDPELAGRVALDCAHNGQTLLIGGNEWDAQTRSDGNSVFLVDKSGTIRGSYVKRQLVPFGEYVPGRDWLKFLVALHLTIYDRKKGAARQALLDAGAPIGRVGVAICYESSYGELTREQVARGAGLLSVVTDDTWFGRTAAARQHAAIAAIRAAECDRYLVRAGSTGISQILDPAGRVLTEAPLFESRLLTAPVESRTTRTLYTRWGDWFVWLCWGVLAVILGAALRRRPEGDQ
ncbi:apolipoprotein N-acyltransferase [Capsulimonas corticalis]|uniref:Apolipoprotein N-acyltransferase n=1 Tax=Capsulimonas corticalis TaxID=2219043 RepID=A0A402CQA3_9BACT|nr:apolipoprotein N-acyltransferase [Capsulimonas corticalis]BDI32800.1 apolipoprotein N-acyltransferase [Capsulimonas corticalis]